MWNPDQGGIKQAIRTLGDLERNLLEISYRSIRTSRRQPGRSTAGLRWLQGGERDHDLRIENRPFFLLYEGTKIYLADSALRRIGEDGHNKRWSGCAELNSSSIGQRDSQAGEQ